MFGAATVQEIKGKFLSESLLYLLLKMSPSQMIELL